MTDIPYVGTFNTSEVRPYYEPTLKNSMTVSLANTHPAPPGPSLELNELALLNDANIRVKAYTSDITNDSFKINIDSWSDSTLRSAGCTWLEIASSDPDFQFGSFNTQEDHPWNQPQLQTTRHIEFPRKFSGGPLKVVVWLTSLDMGREKNWRLKAYADNVTLTGFDLHIDTWFDSAVFRCCDVDCISSG